MLQLTNTDYISEGKYQTVYHHPDKPNRCVKIEKKDAVTDRFYHEMRYLKKVSKKKIANSKKFFSSYYGIVATNLGPGYEHELITDLNTRKVSKTLEYYLEHNKPEYSDDYLMDKLIELKKSLIKYKVIANDIRPKNICCQIQLDNSLRFIIIDGLGHKDFLPLVDWFTFFARKKIERRFIKEKLNNFSEQRTHLKWLRDHAQAHGYTLY